MRTFNITFLGTCACDFSKKLLTDFEDKFDNDARRASSILVNKRFLIDCGPHCPDSLRIANVDVSKITDIFISHLHSDHFNVANIERIAELSGKPLNLWIRGDAVLPEIHGVEIRKMDKFTAYNIGDETTVTCIAANHDPNVFPQHFIFEKAEKKIFYGCDGAWFLTDSYNFIKNADFSLMILDATCGDYEGDYRMAEHNSIPMIRLMLPSLKTVGIVGENTRIYLSHIAPSLHKPHAEIAESIRTDGLEVAYDGLTIEV